MFDAPRTPARDLLRACVVATSLLLVAGIAPAQETQEDPPKPAKIFTDDRVISARVEAPWGRIMRAPELDTVYPGLFRYTESDGRAIEIPIEITTRGLTRKRVCEFPPLRIRFEKEAAKGTAFRGAGNLKLVTHCLPSKRHEQYYVMEYLVYRIYNLATPLSYRVQGLDLAYADGPDDERTTDRFAFLIEDPDDVAKRNVVEKLDINDIEPVQLDALETSRFMVFQYLVGNLDWSALGGPDEHCCHNARLLGAAPDATPYFVIPYDFDSSGVVNAHYATPPAGLSVRNVRQRLYRGFCAHNDALPQAISQFLALRGEIEQLLANESRLNDGSRKRALKYLDDAFEDFASERTIEKDFIGNCRG